MAVELQPIYDRIIKITMIGDVSDEDRDQFQKEYDDLVNSLSPEKQVHHLVDSTQQGKISPYARKLFTEQYKSSRVGKVAVFGSNRFVRVMAAFMIKASGRDNIRFFDTEADALAWLQEIVEKETVS